MLATSAAVKGTALDFLRDGMDYSSVRVGLSGAQHTQTGASPPGSGVRSPLLQGGLEHLLDVGHKYEREGPAQVRRELLHLRLVERRGDNGLDPAPLSGQGLRLEAADRQHLPGERDLA